MSSPSASGYPQRALREALVNAVAHRNYEDASRKIRVQLFPDRIVVASPGYLSRSAVALAVSIFPWCVAMGTTFPFMMAYIREINESNTQSFSFLYLANVLGAMGGTLLTVVVLIELLGFHHTLWVAAAMNGTISCISCALGWRSRPGLAADASPALPTKPVFTKLGLAGAILFCTGFTSMAMEVVWTRSFTPVLKTQVYSFAMIVFTYLGATFAGSLPYRRHLLANAVRSKAQIMAWLTIAGFLPVIVNDVRRVTADYGASSITPSSAFDVLASIVPFCALLGYRIPKLSATNHAVQVTDDKPYNEYFLLRTAFTL